MKWILLSDKRTLSRVACLMPESTSFHNNFLLKYVKRSYLLIVLIVVIGLILGFKYLTRKKPVTVVVQEVEIGIVEATVANTRAGSVKRFAWRSR